MCIFSNHELKAMQSSYQAYTKGLWLCFLLLLLMEDVQLTRAEAGQNTAWTVSFPWNFPSRLTHSSQDSTVGVSFKYYHYGATEHFLLIKESALGCSLSPSFSALRPFICLYNTSASYFI